MSIATEARKTVRIAGETYYYTQPEPHTYKFEFADGRYIGQISYIKGTGREKDYWLPGTTGMHVPFWGEACALLLQEYWRTQALHAAPPPAPVVERAPKPEPPKQEAPLAPQEEWITPQEAAARLKRWGEQSVSIRIRAGFFQARQLPWGERHRWELRWPGLEEAQAIMGRPVPPEVRGPAAVARQKQASADGPPTPDPAPVVAVAVPLPEPGPPPTNGHHEGARAPFSSPEEIEAQQQAILAFVQEHGEITRQDCVKTLHLSQDQATKRLMALRQMGRLQRVSKGAAVRYILTTPAPEPALTPEPAPAPEPPPVPVPTLEAGLQHQIEQLHQARIADARTIGRLTAQVEILEQRLAACEAPKPAPRKWWQP
jgi:hypothetical protein